MNRPTSRVARPPGSRRGVTALGVALLTAAAGSGTVAPAQARVPASQPLVVLLHAHVARVEPNPHARRVQSIRSRRPLSGVRTVLPVLGESARPNGKPWLHVRLPGRPNGHSGWISAQQSTRTSTHWRILITVFTRQVTVYHSGRVERRFQAIVGKPSTPTPRGHFFIEEAIALSPRDAGGPFALATSARSHVLQEFDGGPGQIAIHGTNNLSGALGTAASHGCVRLSTPAITWLAQRIGPGTPLTIRR
jgi:lipoprotein-anchoring transpeptidase ErfK/SrfK